MKLIKAITHPYTLIISFFAILISGTHFGGFYLLYLLLALPHGGSYSLLAFFGILILLIGYNRFRKSKTPLFGRTINVIGLMLLILSLFFFFYNDKEKSNYDTFHLLVPQISLIIFALLAFIFLVDNLISMFKSLSNKDVEGRVNY